MSCNSKLQPYVAIYFNQHTSTNMAKIQIYVIIHVNSVIYGRADLLNRKKWQQTRS